MNKIRVLILEDDLETLYRLLQYLSLLQNYCELSIAVTILSEYSQVEEYLNKSKENIFDMEPQEFQISNKTNNHSAVFIGRLDEQTGILTYVKAYEQVRKKIPRFEFLIVGDGKYKKDLSGIGKMIGFQDNPEKYFQKYHFAFVSRYLSIFEALAAKKLVFAIYDNPVKEDYLRMSPFAKYIVIAGNENELSEKNNLLYEK